MMAAYKHLITMKKKNFKKVIDLSGVQEHSSFIRKFRKQFGMSPTQAFVKKDEATSNYF
jgi:AraC-like DNA-binding protein